MTLPDEFIQRIQSQLGNEFEAFEKAADQPALRGIRMNPLKPIPLPDDALDPIPWARSAYYLQADSLLGASVLHEAGAFYLQEPSAMLPATILDVQPGDRILDLCAAPGGKSTQIGALLENKGLLVSNEIVRKRAHVLSSNIERMGLQNCVVTCAAPELLANKWPGFFDKILVDAPCSGEGMFRRHPETIEQWNAQSPLGCAKRQKPILEAAAAMLKKGGILVYSTCTFSPEENEQQIADFLADHPEFEPVDFTVPVLGKSGDGMMRIWPHRAKGEGHFAAKLVKKSGEETHCLWQTRQPGKNDVRLYEQFAREYLLDMPTANAFFSSKLVNAPEGLPILDGIPVLRLGLTLGEIKSGRFEPDHALFMSCKARYQLELTDIAARKWLHGEALECDESISGWCSPAVQTIQLGFGKATQGILKNHYPKGLRK